MSSKSRSESEGRMVRHRAGKLPKRTPQRMSDLKRLSQRPDEEIDTSEIPKQDPRDERWVRGGHRVGGIRGAIILEMGRRGLTRYKLWKLARKHCPKLSNSAVYEYLDGRRQVGGDYIEAMLEALELEVHPRETVGSKGHITH
jgi:hypothetical protein